MNTTNTDTLPLPTADQPAARPYDHDDAEAALASTTSCCGGDDAACDATDTRTTRTGAFLAAVRAAAPDQRLVFQLDGVPLIGPGYHVTEVKAVTTEAMDCGGVADQWRETVIQLWNPGEEPESGHMAAGKFLAIYDRVAAHVPVAAEAEVRFEYGDLGRPAIHYHVADVEPDGERLLVHLRAPLVTCKARDRDALACRGGADDENCCA